MSPERLSFKAARRASAPFMAAAILFAVPLVAQMKHSPYDANTKFAALTILVGPDGPSVSEVTMDSRPFFLLVENRSGLRNLRMVLTQSAALRSASADDIGAGLAKSTHAEGAQDRITLLELHPGSYYLTVAEKLAWRVHIVVKP